MPHTRRSLALLATLIGVVADSILVHQCIWVAGPDVLMRLTASISLSAHMKLKSQILVSNMRFN